MKNKVLVSLVLLAAFGLAIAGLVLQRNKGPEFSRVVFLVVDTLRADHLPFYGYQTDTAPFLASLQSRAVLFERTFSTCSSTAPAMASVFTGLYPSQHTVITGMQATKHLAAENPTIALNRIPSTIPTLGEYFKAAGYSTFGVADNLNISQELGFTRGFDRFETFKYKGASTVNATVKQWSAEIKNAEKLFLYIHYMDPHAPYNKREPWFVPGKNRRENLRNAYDSEIRYTDEHIRELFEEFGFTKDTLVVFISDHGEEFWEHGRGGHGKTLYREVTHVPFFIYHPEFESARINHFVSLVDVLPTLLEIVGIAPKGPKVGQSLAQYILARDDNTATRKRTSEDAIQNRAIFSQLLRRPEHPKPVMEAVIENAFHLIVTASQGSESPESENAATPDVSIQEELFNLDGDWLEQNNIASSEEQTVAALRQRLEQLHAGASLADAEKIDLPLDQEAIRSLRTLGYIE